ncbi:GNAT family N-acetyltransferase [Sporomusa malonica]|uniref:Acetyltransferase (GNAT) family protein n=1 Tax=Sporomusa malonica TaxID=112901 RepID=A0A1W1ZKE3_9FIRM|nr:GNAT family N-acetyltransferase [Sporomusa malonica]SMC48854.1 Acetyltransferase (GNAT) family protein [Sporomusa malonica]
MDLIYKQVNTEQELIESINIIRESFLTVAGEFNLTSENAPTNPAFIEIRHLQKMREKGIVMLGVFCKTVQIGFVAIEKHKDNGFYMERLAVLPKYRHKGCGRQIVEYVTDYVADQGGDTVLIGVIDNHEILKAWYRKLGFTQSNVKHFTHLPFPVCYMEKRLHISSV